jgi:hypothetical protein
MQAYDQLVGRDKANAVPGISITNNLFAPFALFAAK